MVFTLLSAAPPTTSAERTTSLVSQTDPNATIVTDTSIYTISENTGEVLGNNIGTQDEKLQISSEPLERKFAEIIEKSLEQMLGKNDIEESPVADLPCSNHNVEILEPKIVDTVILEDTDVEPIDNEDIVNPIKRDEDKNKTKDGDAGEEQHPANHSLKKKDVSSTDEQQKTDTTTTDKPGTIVELMNRLKEEMAKVSMKDLSPVLATINNMTLLGRMDATESTPRLPVHQEDPTTIEEPSGPTPCTCGVFLSGQFKKGSKDQPKGVPVLTQEMDIPFLNNAVGTRQCTNKCLELVRINLVYLCILF